MCRLMMPSLSRPRRVLLLLLTRSQTRYLTSVSESPGRSAGMQIDVLCLTRSLAVVSLPFVTWAAGPLMSYAAQSWVALCSYAPDALLLSYPVKPRDSRCSFVLLLSPCLCKYFSFMISTHTSVRTHARTHLKPTDADHRARRPTY